ncbi:uncharacterized protein LOC132405968 isoform X2 [Hypanus sabinus]|uniref:uncharacterized protein LOC132405968 isoform X2 n=1 Tax=Hypanus sabinus TaxID=79690 RepID=UPI0028C4BA6C|nr:uncharacterized protein LOC132405968 isoform X2 [Hypanus sabinus]
MLGGPFPGQRTARNSGPDHDGGGGAVALLVAVAARQAPGRAGCCGHRQEERREAQAAHQALLPAATEEDDFDFRVEQAARLLDSDLLLPFKNKLDKYMDGGLWSSVG